MNGSVKSLHPSQLKLRERSIENEIHSSDGIYVKRFDTSLQRSQEAERDHTDNFLDRVLFNDRDEPGKKFEKFVRKRDKLSEIHQDDRFKHPKFSSEMDRIQKAISKVPLSLEPLN